jgi:hypothetical protein
MVDVFVHIFSVEAFKQWVLILLLSRLLVLFSFCFIYLKLGKVCLFSRLLVWVQVIYAGVIAFSLCFLSKTFLYIFATSLWLTRFVYNR